MHFILDALLANALVALFLAVLAALVSFRVRRPALAHAMWLMVLLKLVTPPLFSLHWPFNVPGATEEVAQLTEEEPPIALVQTTLADAHEEREDSTTSRQNLIEALDALRAERKSVLAMGSLAPSTPVLWNSWHALRTILGSVWLGGTTLWFCVFAWRIVRFHRLLGLGQAADDELQAQAQDLAVRIGLSRCPQVWVVPGRVSPLLWMVGRRGRLVLPEQLLGSLNGDQRAALLTHEMAHAHRLDHWVRWIELCALGLYWWNPVAWWARHELHQAEEECCDAWVIWILPGAAKAYAKALLQTVTFLDARPCLPPVASGAGHVSLLKRRLSMIVKEPLSPRLPKPLFFAALVWGLLVLPFAPDRVVANSVAEENPQASARQSSQSVDQRIEAIEKKLDKVLKALDAQSHADANAKKAAEDSRREESRTRQRAMEAEARAKQAAERDAQRKNADEQRAKALEKAAEARAKALEKAAELKAKGLQQGDEGKALAEKVRKAIEESMSQQKKQVEQQRESAVRSLRQAAEAKEKASKDDKKPEKSERRITITSPNIDAKTRADLERMIKEKIGSGFKADELKKIIQDSVDPNKIRQIQVQVQEIMRKTMDEKKREMDKAFDEMRKSLETQQLIIQKKQATGEQQRTTETRSRVASPARDNELRDMQRRLERLEQRLDKVISSLEAQQKKSRQD